MQESRPDPRRDLTGISPLEIIGQRNNDLPPLIVRHDRRAAMLGILPLGGVVRDRGPVVRGALIDQRLAAVIEKDDPEKGRIRADAVPVDQSFEALPDGRQALAQAVLHAHAERAIFKKNGNLAGKREIDDVVAADGKKMGDIGGAPVVLDCILGKDGFLKACLGRVVREEQKSHIGQEEQGDNDAGCRKMP